MILDITSECTKIDPEISTFVHNIIILIKIAVPLALILFGMLDFGKGVIAQKEDEIKKGQNAFIKRLLAAAVVFLMISVTQLVMNIIDKESSGEIANCANLIINGRTGKELTDEEEKKINNTIIEQCCEEAEGRVIKNNNGNVSCMDPNAEKYKACKTEKTESLKGGN